MSVVHVKMPDSVRIQAGARSDIQPTELDGTHWQPRLYFRSDCEKRPAYYENQKGRRLLTFSW